LSPRTIRDKGAGFFECASAIYVVFLRRSPAELGPQPGEGFEIALVVAGEAHDHLKFRANPDTASKRYRAGSMKT
jgi:hypothetical protein